MTSRPAGTSLRLLGMWFAACRPKTLTAAVAPIAVGTGLAVLHGPGARWHIAVCALLSAAAIQIATNLFNDAIDFQKGTDTAERIGPRRVTQSGQFSARQVYLAGALAALAALVFGVPLVVAGGWPIVVIGLVSLFFAWGYTGGPLPLAYLGLGDLFVILFFGLVAVGGTYYLHTGHWDRHAVVAGLQVGCLAAALLTVNNLRDVDGDRRAGKKTLPVRFGVGFGRMEITVMSLLPFGLGGWWVASSVWAALLPILSLPLAIGIIRGVHRAPPGPIYNTFLARAAALGLTFGLLLTVGMVL